MNASPNEKRLAYSDHIRPAAEDAARQLIRSWCDYGPQNGNQCDVNTLPGIHGDIARRVLEAIAHGAEGFTGIFPHFTAAPEGLKIGFIECNEVFSPRPGDCGPLLEIIARHHRAFKLDVLTDRLLAVRELVDDPKPVLAEIAALAAEGGGKTNSLIVDGVNSYPTETPAEDVILGNGWLRRGDIANFISTAGAGKSVAVTQAPMAWGIGLPYMGIHPARPLRILLFSGEDDGVTIGQCREGFLEHSETITGRQLTAKDLEPLDSMLRTEFSREHVGLRFHIHLDRLLTESPADLVIINPLLSYVGGEIVACASEWLRAGLMPILQKHGCAALIAHHTGKMSKDGWENTDDTYSAIGGGEMANIPRSILTLRPTPADGLSVLRVAKRQTTGWKDDCGNFTASYFLRRTNDPTRPAWLPVGSDEAEELLDASKGTGGGARAGKKATSADVVKAVETGAMERQALIKWIERVCTCSDKTAIAAINDAEAKCLVSSYTEPNPKGGNRIKWFRIP